MSKETLIGRRQLVIAGADRLNYAATLPPFGLDVAVVKDTRSAPGNPSALILDTKIFPYVSPSELRDFPGIPKVVMPRDYSPSTATKFLEQQADSVLTHIDNPSVVAAQLRSVIRRDEEKKASRGRPLVVVSGDIVIDINKKIITENGVPVLLEKRQWQLVDILTSRPDSIVSYEELATRIHNDTYKVGDFSQMEYRINSKFSKDKTPLVETAACIGLRIPVDSIMYEKDIKTKEEKSPQEIVIPDDQESTISKRNVLVVDDDYGTFTQLSQIDPSRYTITFVASRKDAEAYLAQQLPLAVITGGSFSITGGPENKVFHIALSDTADTKDVAKRLNGGADMYMEKADIILELIPRIRSLEGKMKHPKMVNAGDLAINLFDRVVIRNGEPVLIPPNEFKLLQALALHKDRVIDGRTLAKSAWGKELMSEGYIPNSLHKLRRVIDVPGEESRITTYPGWGYRLRE